MESLILTTYHSEVQGDHSLPTSGIGRRARALMFRASWRSVVAASYLYNSCTSSLSMGSISTLTQDELGKRTLKPYSLSGL